VAIAALLLPGADRLGYGDVEAADILGGDVLNATASEFVKVQGPEVLVVNGCLGLMAVTGQKLGKDVVQGSATPLFCSQSLAGAGEVES
jgi:hypothetical protein